MENERAQVSLEMIIVLAALVAVVMLLVNQLHKTAEQGAKALDRKSSDIFREIADI